MRMDVNTARPSQMLVMFSSFQRLLDSQQKQRKVFKKKVTISDKAQEASYLVAELVAKKMKSHTIAESLIMPACKIIVRTMLGEEAECEVSKVPVSDNKKKKFGSYIAHLRDPATHNALVNLRPVAL